MLHDDFPVRPVALMAQIPACSQADGFIHAQMDPAAAEGFAEMGNHGFHQRNGALLTNHQIVHGVPHGGHILPANGCAQMGQSLDAGDQFYAQRICEIVQLLLLCNREAAPAVAKIGIAGQFIGIFHIEVYGIETHQRQLAQKPLHG